MTNSTMLTTFCTTVPRCSGFLTNIQMSVMYLCEVVSLYSLHTFGKICVDQTTEETVNKDTQTPGGTKGFSLKVGAVHKYYLITEYRNMYLRELHDMINQTDSKWTYSDTQPI